MKYSFFALLLVAAIYSSCRGANTSKNTGNDSAIIEKVFDTISLNKSNMSSSFLNGTWFGENQSRSSTFTLILYSSKDSVLGRYCAVFNGGARIDCYSDSSDINVHGLVYSDSVANIDFDSFFDAKGGKATISLLSSGQLKWKIDQMPVGGDCYAPNEILLNLQKK